MLRNFAKAFSPPIFPEDEDKTRKARYANAITLTFLVIVSGYEIGTRLIREAASFGASDFILFVLAAIIFVGWLLLKRGYVRLTSIILVFLVWAAANGIAASGFGIRDTSFITNFSIVIMAGLLLGWQASVVITFASLLTGFWLGYAEENGIISGASYPATAFAQDMVFVFGLNIVLLYYLINGLENEIKKSKTSLENLEISNRNLSSTQRDLERRGNELTDRGAELETANSRIQRRAAQLEALAQVSQTIISVRDLKELLPLVAKTISKEFNFYHIGIFLIDDLNEFAILSATNSPGGKRMIQRKHQLRVGAQGIVGYVTASGEPRIAMDVGQDAVFFNNPELPDTHSEMALPLKSGNQVIGALDVQSTETAAFTKEDVQLLGLLADQVSLAIENARLFDETRNALAEAQALSRQSIRDGWDRLHAEQTLLGYQYNVIGVTPLESPLELFETSENLEGEISPQNNRVIVPIDVRGETIGQLVVQSSSRTLNQDQIDIIKAVADRVALSAENARLFEETNRTAERERRVSDITGKIRSVNDPQYMIQTAVEELRKALGVSRVEIIPQDVRSSKE